MNKLLGLTHKHHKTPKSLGGTDDEDNMVVGNKCITLLSI